ncbi:tripartite motif-containing protein 2-like [Pollicipes pollicipes]|uniref:tripartite motif-containing protein 2-like n=1 Tax=Pollicipes pollicipes TaxID=41117 RepID=UPI001884D6A2|nr:tripartite motif-containing protein 2-like [Pollicipes pollicipes]
MHECGDTLDAAAEQARRVLKENQSRADKLQNVLCILQGKQDAAKRRLEEAVARPGEAVQAWKAAFRQVIDSEFVHKADLLHGQLAVVRRASVGLHAGLDRVEALRFSPRVGEAAPAVADLLARYVAESREVQPDLLLDFAFREVPADRVLDAEGAEVTDVIWVDGRDGTYTVTFRVTRPGAHVVSVYLYNVHVTGSPYRKPTPPRVVTFTAGFASPKSNPETATVNGTQKPQPGGRLAVRFDHGVRVYSVISGAMLLQVGAGLLRRPFGLAVTEHTAKLYFVAATETRVAVTDLGNNVVYLLNWEGRLVACVGDGGSPGTRLSDPAGVALDAAGSLLVADSKHHRLLVFSADGAPRGSVRVSHELNRPSGIWLDGRNLLVLNYWENTVHRYTLTFEDQE